MNNSNQRKHRPLFGKVPEPPTKIPKRLGGRPLQASITSELFPCQPDHPFLTESAIQDYPFQVYVGLHESDGVFFHGAIALPIYTIDIEHIGTMLVRRDETGQIQKAYVNEFVRRGSFIVIGGAESISSAKKIFIARDVRCAVSLHLATGHPVVVPCGDGNFGFVCNAFAQRHQDKLRVLCIDGSMGFNWRRALRETAARTGMSVITTDEAELETTTRLTFNNIHCQQGLDALARLVDRETWQLEYEGRQAVRNADLTWPYEIKDGRYLLKRIIETLRARLVLNRQQAIAVALWVIYSYVFDLFNIAPVLLVHSPLRECGKTTTGALLCQLVFRPSPTANLSTAALYHEIEQHKPVLIIDEADRFIHGANELVGVLNAGHTRPTAYVVRCIGGQNQRFYVFCPKIILMIGTPPDTIYDRSIAIKMVRKRDDEHIVALDSVWRCRELRILQAQIQRWANDNRERIRQAHVERAGLGSSRAEDNWRPLLSIAKVIGDEWHESALDAARTLVRGNSQKSLVVQLLEDIRHAFETINDDKISSAQLIDLLCTDPEKPWLTANNGRPIGYRQLRKMLDDFNIESDDIRFDLGTVLKGYRREWFADAFARYVADASK